MFDVWAYGKTMQREKKCGKCSSMHEQEDEYVHCNKILCFHCKSITHKTSDKDCPEYKRQKNIKEKMGFDNLSFYDAAIFYPKPDYNKVNRDGVIVFRGQDFPNIGNKDSQKESHKNGGDKITVQERAQVHFNNIIKTKRTFANVCRGENSSKKIIVQDNKDNRKIYNSHLNNPNGRIPQSWPNGVGLRNSQQNKNYDPCYLSEAGSSNNIMPVSANENNAKFFETWYNNFLAFSDLEKSKVRDLILTYYKLLENRDSDSETY